MLALARSCSLLLALALVARPGQAVGAARGPSCGCVVAPGEAGPPAKPGKEKRREAERREEKRETREKRERRDRTREMQVSFVSLTLSLLLCRYSLLLRRSRFPFPGLTGFALTPDFDECFTFWAHFGALKVPQKASQSRPPSHQSRQAFERPFGGLQSPPQGLPRGLSRAFKIISEGLQTSLS